MSQTQQGLNNYSRAFAIVILQSSILACVGWASCFATPKAAVDADVSTEKTGVGGYKVVRMQKDGLSGKNWAFVADCSHPDWPAVALPIASLPSMKVLQLVSSGLTSPIMIHAGDPVRLFRHELLLQIEVAGISEESGSLGDTVRVRLAQISRDDGSIPEEFTGIVQGPSTVEMKK